MTAAPVQPSTFRPDIEGMRALSILAVLAFHAGLPVPGGYVGVDVFFVISGYLITTLLLTEAESRSTISLLGFYARRFRRLLPAATLVLLAALAATFCFAPGSQKSVFSWDVAAAAAYAVNWRFAARSVDYLQEDTGRSPVLHFWSLSVEEQFYLLWPLLISGALAVSRRTGLPLRRAVLFALVLVLLPSLYWSVAYTQSDAQQAFFVTTTRMWELAVGAALAALPPGLRQLRPAAALAVTCGGLCLLGYCLWGLDTGVPWPGFRAVFPVASAALLILGGGSPELAGPQRWLGSKLLVGIGKLSYSLYLWHWPFLVVGQDWWGLTGWHWGLTLVLASFVPAWISYRWVEMPIRSSPVLAARPTLAVSVGAGLSLGVVAAVLFTVAVFAGVPPPGTESGAAAFTDSSASPIGLSVRASRVIARPAQLGAGALGDNPRSSAAGFARSDHVAIFPAPDAAPKDVPVGYLEGCQAGRKVTRPIWCEAGDPQGTTQAVLVGDSKSMQYYEAFDMAGRALGWKIKIAIKASCAFADADMPWAKQPYPECRQFNRAVRRVLKQDPPDVVVTSQTLATAFASPTSRERSKGAMIDGLVRIWKPLVERGTKLVVLLDNPHPPREPPVYDCVAKQPKAYAECAFDREAAIRSSAAGTQRAAAAKLPGVAIVDLTDYICPTKTCAPVIGDVLVYRQGSHLTNTYARSLAPALTRALARIPLDETPGR